MTHPLDRDLAAALEKQRLILQYYPQLREHIEEQKRVIDGWASRGEVSVTQSTSDSVTERAAAARHQWNLEQADVDAGVVAIIKITKDVWEQIHRILGLRERLRAPMPETCSGKIVEGCSNVASDHRDQETGSTISDLCDQCWRKACPKCHEREASSRRKVTVDGRLVPGCEACARAELRRIGRNVDVADVIEADEGPRTEDGPPSPGRITSYVSPTVTST